MCLYESEEQSSQRFRDFEGTAIARKEKEKAYAGMSGTTTRTP